jgi:hypothetical protein
LNKIGEENPYYGDSYVKILIEGYEQGISEAVEHVYDTAFMTIFSKEDWLSTRSKMRENGLLGLEGASFAAVRGMAKLSPLSCFAISNKGWQALISEIKKDGDVPDPVDEAMRVFGPESQMFLMSGNNAGWVVWI